MVRKGLECCKKNLYAIHCIDGECPYMDKYGFIGSCKIQLISDALEIIERQDAVEPVGEDDNYILRCGNCHDEIFCGDSFRDNYCSNCGRRVKWND